MHLDILGHVIEFDVPAIENVGPVLLHHDPVKGGSGCRAAVFDGLSGDDAAVDIIEGDGVGIADVDIHLAVYYGDVLVIVVVFANADLSAGHPIAALANGYGDLEIIAVGVVHEIGGVGYGIETIPDPDEIAAHLQPAVIERAQIHAHHGVKVALLAIGVAAGHALVRKLADELGLIGSGIAAVIGLLNGILEPAAPCGAGGGGSDVFFGIVDEPMTAPHAGSFGYTYVEVKLIARIKRGRVNDGTGIGHGDILRTDLAGNSRGNCRRGHYQGNDYSNDSFHSRSFPVVPKWEPVYTV